MTNCTCDTFTGNLTVQGNLGVGTSVPAARVHVADATEAILKLQNTGSTGSARSTVKFANRLNTDWNWILYNDSGLNGSDNFQLAHNSQGGTVLYANAAGQVGIDTTSPSNRLSVATTAATDGIGVFGPGSSNLLVLTDVGSGAYNGMTQAGDRAIIYSGVSIDNPGGGLVLAPWRSNTSGIRIDPNGNVGIGTASPTQQLHLTGNLQCNGILVSSNILINGALQNSLAQTLVDTGGCYYVS